MILMTDQVRKMSKKEVAAIADSIVDVGGADGSIYRAELKGGKWILVTSASGSTTYKVGEFTSLQDAFQEILAIAADREG